MLFVSVDVMQQSYCLTDFGVLLYE